MRQLATVFACA